MVFSLPERDFMGYSFATAMAFQVEKSTEFQLNFVQINHIAALKFGILEVHELSPKLSQSSFKDDL